MKKSYLLMLLVIAYIVSCSENKEEYKTITKTELNDKIKGAWAGKMIGVMHGIGMEFLAVGETFEAPIPWAPEMVERSLGEDDIYGQLNFMSTMDKNQGLKTPVAKIAEDFAHAGFSLCHANLQGRKNYLDGILPPESGSPKYNMHANDIDFQIESDYIGFMNPGMPYSAALMADSVGRIMAYGDGLYGGMFVSSLHALAFFENDAKVIVEKALKCIPAESEYAQAIQVVLDGYKEDPTDWRKTWQKLQDRWGEADVCVPYHLFNIDATINGSFIAMGLVFGENDMGKTIEVAVRCGQDSDCNASNAAVVIGIMKGYEAIDENLKSHIPNMEDKPFLHTDYSYKKAVAQTQAYAEENILSKGGSLENNIFQVKIQEPQFTGVLEQAFPNKKMSYQVQMSERDKYMIDGLWTDFVNGDGDEDLYKVSTQPGDIFEINFKGTGITLMGSYNVDGGTAMAYVDGKPLREFNCYYHSQAGKWSANRQHIIHAMDLEEGEHTLKIEVLDKKMPKSTGHKIYIERAVIFTDK